MIAPALFDLSGRTALVTGSTRGLGEAIARALGGAGARVAVNGRTATAVDERVTGFVGDGIEAVAAPFDVTDEAAVEAAVAQLGAVDVLVNNAGMNQRKPLEQFTLDEWHRIFDVNVTSAFLVARAVVPGMIERGRGKIINVCSVNSEIARDTISPYVASKGALRNLTKAMCADWARHGIQANGIGPGYFATELNAVLREDPQFDAWLRQRVPAGRWGDPSELAGVVLFLASAASDFVNGQVIYVDGGMTAVV